MKPPAVAVVAVDVGGTSTKGALVGPEGALVTVRTRPTGAGRDPAAVVDDVAGFAADLAAQAEEVTDAPPAAAGIAVPGLVDETTGRAVYSANIGWRDLPIGELMAARLNLPVAIGQDVRAGALGEHRYGAGTLTGADSLFVAIGTGIAGTAIVDGTPYQGSRGWAGEIGHVPVVPDGEPCACGQRGCLETYASAAALARRYRSDQANTPDGMAITAEDVLARAAAGDRDAARIWDEAVDALAVALTMCTLTLDPALIIIGGGLAAAGDRLFRPLRAGLGQRLAFRPAPPIEPARLGARAALLGAALLAWRVAEGGDPP